MEAVNQGHIYFIVQSKSINAEVKKFCDDKLLLSYSCVPLEITQPLKADFAVGCAVILNSAMLSYLFKRYAIFRYIFVRNFKALSVGTKVAN